MEKNLILPLPAEHFIPHRLPMRLVDTLLSWEGGTGVIEAQPGAGCILVGDDGTLDEAALVELLAQGYAAVKGYDDLLQGKPVSEGYLVGIRRFRAERRPQAGEKLVVRIRTVGSFEAFAVAEGEIEAAGEAIAGGTVKLWVANRAGSAGEGA